MKSWQLQAAKAKFSEVVEPLIGRAIEVPESLRGLYARPTSVTTIEPTLDALVAAMPPAG